MNRSHIRPGRGSSRRLARLVPLLSLAWLLSSIAGCKKEPTRWDNAAEAPIPPKAADPAQSAQASPPEKAGASFNKAFPADGTDGYKRVFTQEKEGFAEAKLQKDGKDVATLAVTDVASDAEAKGKFTKSTESIDGNPLVTVGKNQSALLIKDRYQVKVSSMTLDAGARKQLLGKFDLKALASL
jgi:hypothetical protein